MKLFKIIKVVFVALLVFNYIHTMKSASINSENVETEFITEFGSQINSMRKIRGVGTGSLGAKLVKITAWSIGMTLSGVAIAATDNAIKDAYYTKNQNKLARKAIECQNNNFGCLENVCWTNCGPRLYSADWCLTTKTGKTDENNNAELASCTKDSECDPCYPCGSVCSLEGGSIKVINGSLYSIN